MLTDGGYVGQLFAQAIKQALGGGGHGADCQARRTSQVSGHPQALGCTAQFCRVGQKQVVMKELRETKLDTSLQFIHLAVLALLLRRS